MALVDFGTIEIPTNLPSADGLTSLTIDASGERVAFLVRCPRAGDLEGFGIRLGTVTVGETLKGSFQNAVAGAPDGTEDQSGTVACINSDDDAFKDFTMGSNRTVTAGELVWCVVDINSFSAANLNVNAINVVPDDGMYASHRLAGAYTAQARGSNVALRYSGGVYYPMSGVLPGVNITSVDFGSGSTPDEIAQKLVLTAEIKACGMGFRGRINADCQLVLYDSGGSALETITMDSDDTHNANSTTKRESYFTPRTLAAGTYYVALKPTTASTVRLYYAVVSTAAKMDQFPMGQAAHWAQQTNGGGFSATTTQRPFIYLLANQIHDGTGGGGGVTGVIGE
jgi:hypothetical protein